MQIYTFLRFPARILTKKHKILDYFKSILTSTEKGCHFLGFNLVICRTFFNSLGNTLLHYATSIPFPANNDMPLPAFMPFETISPNYFLSAKQKNIWICFAVLLLICIFAPSCGPNRVKTSASHLIKRAFPLSSLSSKSPISTELKDVWRIDSRLYVATYACGPLPFAAAYYGEGLLFPVHFSLWCLAIPEDRWVRTCPPLFLNTLLI